jgi:hypothetical protein
VLADLTVSYTDIASTAEAVTFAGAILCDEASANMAEVVAFLHALLLFYDNHIILHTDCSSVIKLAETVERLTARQLSRLSSRPSWCAFTQAITHRVNHGLTLKLVKVDAHIPPGMPGYSPENDRADGAAKRAAQHVGLFGPHAAQRRGRSRPLLPFPILPIPHPVSSEDPMFITVDNTSQPLTGHDRLVQLPTSSDPLGHYISVARALLGALAHPSQHTPQCNSTTRILVVR